MSLLQEALRDYLRVRRQLGFKLELDGRLLENFVDFVQQAGATTITTELALRWARLPAQARPHRWRQRLGIVRGFARYMATIDPATEVPSPDLLPARAVRVAPYIYTDADIAALMATAGAMSPPLRAATFQTLIGLLAATGLRLGEALSLDRQHVDLKAGTLHVRAKQQSSGRCPCTPARPQRCQAMPGCVIATGRSPRRRRSSSRSPASDSIAPRFITRSSG